MHTWYCVTSAHGTEVLSLCMCLDMHRRLRHENIILTVQPLRHAYRFNPSSGTFLEDASSTAAPLGSGYSLCQLAWLGDAVSVNKEGAVTTLESTVMERFATQGVE